MKARTLTIESFAKRVKDHLFDNNPKYAKICDVQIISLDDPYGNPIPGLTIGTKNDRYVFLIHLDKPYEMYKNREADLPEITESIIDAFVEAYIPKESRIDVIEDYEASKDHLFMKLVNISRSYQLLKEVPYMRFGDLAVIFQAVIFEEEKTRGIVTVKRSWMERWGVDEKTLFDVAQKNMEESNPLRIRHIAEVFSSEEDFPDVNPMSLFTSNLYEMRGDNRDGGAIGLVFINKIRRFAKEHKTDLFLIPASTDELLLLPDDGSNSERSIQEFQKNMNRIIPQEYVLTDNIYYYSRSTDTIWITGSHETCNLEPGKPITNIIPIKQRG